MQRKIIYFLVFTCLIILAAVFLLTDRKSTIRQKQIDFALEDPSQVDRIMIDNKVSRILIEKDNGIWHLNGKYIARQETVRMFLQALGRIEVLSPASKTIRDSIISRLEESGTRLTLYRGDKMLKSIVLYYEKRSIPGTYMMDNRKKQPYRVGLTGYKSDNIENLFSIKEAEWKENVLFACSPGDIAAVEIEYPQHREQSFRIARDEMNILRLYPTGKKTSTVEVNPEELADYLSFFGPVHYSSPDGVLYDSRQSGDPFAILTITDTKQTIFSMRAFRITESGSQNHDMNRYLAYIDHDSLPVVLKYTDTDPIMKVYGDFLKK
jgi:hypothetical protein